jgi:hypothetical protein
MTDINEGEIELIGADEYDEFAEVGDRLDLPYDDIFVDGKLFRGPSVLDDDTALEDLISDI